MRRQRVDDLGAHNHVWLVRCGVRERPHRAGAADATDRMRTFASHLGRRVCVQSRTERDNSCRVGEACERSRRQQPRVGVSISIRQERRQVGDSCTISSFTNLL